MAAPRAHPAVRYWPRRLLVGTCVLLVIGIVFAGGAYVYLRWRLGQIDRLQVDELTEDRGSVMNVLLVGSDSRSRLTGDLAEQAGKNQVSGSRSDTIMVLHVDAKTKKAAILSIPRDLYVRIPGTTRADRINTTFASGGAAGLVRAIKENLGIQVNHYVEVDFVGFRGIVDTVGGVNVYVPAPARDNLSGLDIKTPGCVRFDGDTALAWVRSRHYEYFESGRWRTDPTSDLGRIQRQQDFIRRMMKKAVSSGVGNPLTLNRLIGIGVKDVTLDSGMSTSDLVRVARRFRSLDPETVDMITLPTTPATVGGASVLRLNKQQAQVYIDRLNGVGPPSSDGTGVRPGDVRVRILNGKGTDGAAADAGEALDKLGFTVADRGDADSYNYTRTLVRYAGGQHAKAQLVQRYLSAGAVLREDTSLRTVDVVLTLGADYTGTRTEPASPSAGSSAAAPTTAPGRQQGPATPAPKGAPARPSC
ncbi:MAG TPA: LCP family protein [Acidimicrobiales bacterium]|nr:LCP family protein [Acidimicrobiales bacterium]